MSFSELQWMGPELARAGLLFNEEWVERNTSTAKLIYPNQGLHVAATLLAALHPRALDYLMQAPVLALAATYGGKVHAKRERAYVAMNFGPLVRDGKRLRDVMASFKVAYPLRQVSGNAIRPGVWPVIQAITRLVDHSSISQAIPADPTRHMHWLGDLEKLHAVLSRRGLPDDQFAAILKWAMFALARTRPVADHGQSPGEIADYLICNQDSFNPRWTWDRMIAETSRWHEALANAEISASRDVALYDKEVSYGGWPHQATVADHEFVALRSLRALIVEGKAMHHCVASYYRDICSGRCKIYSIRKDGRRVATVEYVEQYPRPKAAQIKGPCNAAPAKTVIAAVDRFLVTEMRAPRGAA